MLRCAHSPGYFNLDDNINVQVAAAFLLIFFVLIGWIYEFTRLQLECAASALDLATVGYM